MDAEEAAWLAEHIQKAVAEISYRPGLTIEVDDRPDLWVQIIPEIDPSGAARLSGYVLNFPARMLTDSMTLSTTSVAEIIFPPGIQLIASEPGSHATLWIDPGIDLRMLAQLCGEVLVNLVGAHPHASINIQIEHEL